MHTWLLSSLETKHYDCHYNLRIAKQITMKEEDITKYTRLTITETVINHTFG